jgi:hypothetical protein
LQATLAHGPQLVHWVMRCDDLDARCARLAAAGVDPGRVLAAERATPHGLLRWRIAVRDDGARGAEGALPTLIEWGGRHPVDTLPGSGVVLQHVAVAALPRAVAACCDAPGVVQVEQGPPIAAQLATPRGPVTLSSLILRRSDVLT